MQPKKVSYEGIFFEGEELEKIKSLEKEHLPVTNDQVHCTFKYHPNEDELFDNLLGKTFEIKLIGYASNGKNSGFEIELPSKLRDYYINYDETTGKLKVPHITVSLAEDAKAVNTKKLKFIPLPKKQKILGKFGYWIKEDDKEYVSYEKITY